eukprot:TRINITY_DN21466_c0_g1_i1.p1 TRINITY_DN21466_c0_g1~~TRINITY_DN21466_c0_g1_i1.p1  ORF type:complete len:456 (+),score=145.19 TRINITY_DN21466_c0_g1_i1:70-1368(+)
MRALVCVPLLAAAAAGLGDADTYRKLLQPISEEIATKYNCSVQIAIRTKQDAVSVAAGTANFNTGRALEADDVMVWGSLTKVLTGSSIMQLASQGHVDLDAPCSKYVDPFLQRSAAASGGKQWFTKMEQLYGPNATKVTVRQLLGMHSGIPDFDTAVPCRSANKSCVPTDSLRAELYADPMHNYGPIELMSLPWVAKNVTIIPDWTFEGTQYSSTNFMLLGMILAGHQGWSSWDGLMQADFLPASIRGKYQHLAFGAHGAPGDFTEVHGYDRTNYNGNSGSRDVYNVAGTFSGWTASDILGTAADLAELGWDVYGPEYNVAPKEYVDQMIPIWPWYGLATFNLTHSTGRKAPTGTAYGHLGATYGYQSIVSYHPEIEATLAIATNLETDYQRHPSDALCLAFNAVYNHLHPEDAKKCSYVPGGYYSGGCTCK